MTAGAEQRAEARAIGGHAAEVPEAPAADAQPVGTAGTGVEPSAASAGGIDARVFADLARRDRARLAAAMQEIGELRQRVAALENSRAQLAVEEARRRFRRLPAWVRGPIAWAVRGRLPAGTPPSPSAPSPAQGVEPAIGVAPQAGPARGMALVIDDHWPRPDRDSGSIDTVNLLLTLRALGFRVRFIAAREADGAAVPPALGEAGVETWFPPEPIPGSDPETVLEAAVEAQVALLAPSVDVCVLCRVYCGGRFLEAVQRHCTKARVVFNSVDLHFVREARRAEVSGDAALRKAVETLRRREEHLIRASDVTVVVSQAERELLAATLPQAYVVEMPLARPLAVPRTPFAGRRGIGFIGGFAHAPNRDAVEYFLDQVWPLVLRGLPDAQLSIVGADFPPDLLEGRPGRVRALGHVPDVGPWFEALRLTVAPLRYGAGAKGKVASSLSAGVPCVATPVAAEGMGLGVGGPEAGSGGAGTYGEGSGVLVAAGPGAFADAVLQVHEDAALWSRLSTEGLDHARAALSLDTWRDRLDAALLQLGL